jgi:uncharacterized membrane protein
MARTGGQRPVAAARTESQAAQMRVATIVIVVAMLAWMGASWLGSVLNLPVRYAFLIDLACMAAMVWALIVLARVWRTGRQGEN